MGMRRTSAVLALALALFLATTSAVPAGYSPHRATSKRVATRRGLTATNTLSRNVRGRVTRMSPRLRKASARTSRIAFGSIAVATKAAASAPPVVNALSQYNGAAGTTITITGTGFGAQKRDSIVWFNGTTARFVTWTDTCINFLVPKGVGAGYVGIQNSAGMSNGLYFIPFNSPVVNQLSASAAGVGSDITITGNTFETTQGSGWVSFGGTPGVVKSWSDTQIVVTVPQGATSAYVGVIQHDVSSNGIMFYPFVQPSASTLSTQYALIGDSITLTGTGFGAAAQQVILNGVTYSPSSWTDTSVSFVVPAGAMSGYCGVVRDGHASNGIYLFVAPRITSTSATWSSPLSQVTVTGQGFGATDGQNFQLLYNGSRVAADTWSDTSVTFTVPSGAVAGYIGFTDALGAATSNGVWLDVVQRANITSVSAADISVSTTLTVVGTGFGAAGSGQILLAGQPITIVSWSDTQIEVLTPTAPVYGYISVFKNGVDSNGMSLNVHP